MKLLRSIGVVVLLVFCLLVSGIAYLTLTERGLQWLFTQITRVAPGELQVKEVTGRLGKAFILTGLRYRTPEFTLEIAQINFAWRPIALLDATLWVERLHLWDVVWRQEGRGEPSPPQEAVTLPEVQLPLNVKVESAQVQAFSLQMPAASPTVIETLTFQGNFDGQTLQVTELGASVPEGQLQVSGTIAFRDAYPLDLTTQWRAKAPELGTVAGGGKVGGDLRQLTLRQEVQAPFQLQLRGRLFDLLNNLRWAAVLELPKSDLQRLQPQWPAVRFGLKLKGAGGLAQFKVRGSYQLQEEQLGKFRGKLSGEQVAAGRWLLHQLSLQQAQGQARLAVQGEVTLVEGQPQLNFKGRWQDWVWPLTETAVFSSDWGQVTLDGTPEAYHLQLNSALAGQEIPASEWHLTGTGDTIGFRLEAMQGHLLDGLFNAAGSIRWDPQLTWKLQLEGKSLNPAEKWSEWPGELDFTIDTTGTLQEGAQAITLNLQTLAGTLRRYPVAAQGQVKWEDTIWHIADLKLRSGDSRFSIGGTVGEQLALDWQMVSPDLSQLLPAAQGNLVGGGHLEGKLKMPKMTLRLQGKELAYQDLQVASVAADVNLDLQGEQQSQLLVKARDFAVDARTFHSLKLQGSGTPSQHGLNLTVEAPERSLTLQLHGSWKEEVWQGELRKAQITAPEILGSWEMVNPTPLTLSPTSIDLALWCWRQQATRLCLAGRWQAGEAWQARFRVADFPLGRLTPLLPEKVALEGILQGNVRVQGDAYQLEQAWVQLNASPVRLLQVTSEGETLSFPHQGLQANFRLDEAEGKGSFKLQLAEAGADPVRASFRLPPAPLDLTAWDQWPLEGQLSATFEDLAFLELLLPELEAVQGRLQADLVLGGRFVKPRISGQIELQEGSTQVLPLGLELTGIRLQVAASEAGKVTFNGEVHSGEGQLAFQGQVRLDPAAGWPVSLTVAGKRFQAARTSEVKVLISPQLQITLAEDGIHVEGEVVVPEASLILKDIKRRGGVPVSKDVVVISKEKESSAEAKPLPIYARVRVVLGEKVTVQAYGFKGQIAGNLLVTETPGKGTRGTGELRVEEGQYSAYGQQLDIQQGRVLFAGPISNPRLDVEAVRQVGEVVAGVRIQGLVSSPVLTLFSEPPMNEDSILAYLLLGRPLTTASGDDGQLLAKAATSLGLSGGNLLARRIGEAFGLEEMGVEVGVESKGAEEAEGETQNAALRLGKHLSPRLYIGYGIGIFERFNAFQLRYTLSEHWSLQAETGLESGVDILYNLER